MDNLDKQFATRLGLLGLIPFVLLTLLCWIVHPEWMPFFVEAQLVYGIAILGFLGGLHWGLALIGKERSAQDAKRDLLSGVLPVIIAWFAMSQMTVIGFLVQMAAFIYSYQYDKRMYQRFAMPAWFVELRFRLTAVVVTTQVFTFLAANIRL
ncbi:DUF3429 domain-containing protein [Undibacterium flavidum]|uniref:DUF3429 domain-containing protein n=1 Tax=Undibacterium flavidum TaxID=2762297 RepID=A0ABR6Y9T4_9BURK|nr:DUF3429 domain-containing protein [Undibacterium flavidum]MBC3873300.1 DUF3429 domain-containing protein [Undibacterium flavidum]